jgi:glycerophosphoryl diester phosphodiesterase
VRDFDLVEIRALKVTERVDADGLPVYPDRFPAGRGRFRVHTLAEELEFVTGLNRATGGTTGVYPEIKRPAWHRDQGIDLSGAMLEVLAAYGYEGPDDPVFVQCFDADELRRLRAELGCRMRLVQLIGDNSWGEATTDYDALCSERGLAELARSADAIGPWVNRLYTPGGAGAPPCSTGLVERAHSAGLLVHPYTFRADDLAPGFGDFAEMLRYFCVELEVDGLFTDFPDRVRAFLER